MKIAESTFSEMGIIICIPNPDGLVAECTHMFEFLQAHQSSDERFFSEHHDADVVVVGPANPKPKTTILIFLNKRISAIRYLSQEQLVIKGVSNIIFQWMSTDCVGIFHSFHSWKLAIATCKIQMRKFCFTIRELSTGRGRWTPRLPHRWH